MPDRALWQSRFLVPPGAVRFFLDKSLKGDELAIATFAGDHGFSGLFTKFFKDLIGAGLIQTGHIGAVGIGLFALLQYLI